ncbi:Protein of unknown function [Amycolatopsis xylanica]|uniref:DUF4232 domain-containing protein n=1 Tax=Amycolatopsis xylanica TaxID=589385 RepID=A0A1H3STM1_9PSEU|nr:DUF4232 domain-containing protein [Amycolatopsis xylanica]SDZ41336.1 Protein of unknown function [Amycolatopsis xylanica]
MVRTKVTRVGMVAGSVALAAALAACGNSPSNNPAAPPSSSPAPSSPSSSESPSSSAAPTSTVQQAAPKPDDGLCKAKDVQLSLGTGDGAAGTVYRPLLIKNVSGKPCTIQGFPGISYVAGEDGHQVGKDAFRDGTKGEAVTLANGQSAAADIGFVQVRNFDPGACRPTEVKGLRVYLPQETASNFVPAPGTGCAGKEIPGNQLTVKTVHKA